MRFRFPLFSHFHHAVPAVLLACLGIAVSTAHAAGAGRAAFGKRNPFRADELPEGKLKAGLQALDPQAKEKAMTWLHTFDFDQSDAARHLRVDRGGGVFIVCPDNAGNCEGHSHGAAKPEAAPEESGGTGNIEPEPGDGSPSVEFAAVSVSSPPSYHSKPNATRRIYLDFNGGTVTGTAWNNNASYGTVASWNVKVWSQDADATTFNDSEQAWMKRVWQRVAEDYAPFDVDVTTDVTYDPDNYTGNKDQVGWLLICETTDANGVALPHNGSGGVAYLSVFGNTSYSPTYQPAWVSSTNGGGSESIIAEAASHEMGHNMGLSHDATSTTSYYGGHGSGDISWGPIMGTGYNRNVSQWSKGEYYDANQLQDDLSIISGRVPYRSDDHGATAGTATALTVTGGTTISSTTPEADPANTNTANKGVIERNTDVDVFSFFTGPGTVQLNANPWIQPAGTRGGNLDILLELYSDAGTLVASNNSATLTNAAISTTLSQGYYYLHVRNTGTGTPTISSPSGYTAYGSIGQYFISGTIVSPNLPDPPSNLVVAPGNNSVSLSWSTVSGATSYKVKRSTASGGPYTLLGTTAATNYTDLTVANEATYYYVLSSVNSTGEGADSAQVSATPAPLASAATLASSLGSSGNYGSSVTFTATVSGSLATPTGSVSFFDGVSLLGTETVNGSGQATLVTSTLTLGGHSITASYGGDLIYEPGTSLAFSYTVNPKPVTITGVTAGNKVYDASAAATLSGGVVSGVISGETVHVVPGSGVFDNPDAGTRNVIASGYSISGPNVGNYVLSAQPVPSAAVITPRPVQLSGVKTYDGSINVNASDLIVSNNLDGANLALTGSAELAGKNAGLQSLAPGVQAARIRSATGSTGSNSASSFGVTLAGTPANGNTLVAVIATRGSVSNIVSGITQAGAVWIRAAQAVRSSITTEIWYASGVANAGTSITVSQSAVKSAAVVIEYSGLLVPNPLDQTGAATGTGSSLSTGTTAVTSQPNQLWLGGVGITSASTTVGSIQNGFTSVANAATNGSNNAKAYALERIVSAAGPAATGGTASSSSISWAGVITTFQAAQPGTLALTGSSAGNYTTTGMTGGVTIVPKNLVAGGFSVADKEYDGSTAASLSAPPSLLAAEPPGTGTTLDGRPYSGDAVSTGGSPTAVFSDKHAGLLKPVALTEIPLVGAQAANYTLLPPAGLTANISHRAITVTAVPETKVYDGSTACQSLPILSPEPVSGDLVTSLYQVFATSAAGAGDKEIVPHLSIDDGNGGLNYQIQSVVTSAGTITPAAATVSLSGLLQTHDGTPKPVTVSTAPSDLPVSITYDGSADAPAASGSYQVVATIIDPNHQGGTTGTLVITAEDDWSSWQSEHFTLTETQAGFAGDNADPDGDGLVNLAEYALGGDPHQFTAPPGVVKDSNGLTLTFIRPANLPDVTYDAEISDGLESWTGIPLEVIQPGDRETVRARDPLTSGDPAKRFIRLRFTRP